MTSCCDDKDSYNTDLVIIFMYINSNSIAAPQSKSKFLWEESVFSGQVKNKYPKQDNTWLPQINLLSQESQLKEILKLLNYTILLRYCNFLLYKKRKI